MLSVVVRQQVSYMILKALNSFCSGLFYLGFRNTNNASFFLHNYEIYSINFTDNTKLNPTAPLGVS